MTAAIGFAGNGIVESRLDPGINEIAPLVPGSRGGFGLMQWTGPRRRQFEAYAQQRGSGLDDLDTQLDFLVHELGTTESRARDAIYGAQTAEEAARLVSQRFLRPGIPHLDRRLEETRNVLAMVGDGGLEQSQGSARGPQRPAQAAQAPMPVNALALPPQQQRNAIAPPQFQQLRMLAPFTFG
jgi:hypothetical protein